MAEFYHKKRIFPRCIQITLIGDSELNMLAGNAIIPQGGVMPHIHSALTNGVQLEPPGGKMVEFVFSEHQVGSNGYFDGFTHFTMCRNQNFRRSRIKSCPRKALPWGAERREMRFKVKNFEGREFF